jgi:hypothetical protein
MITTGANLLSFINSLNADADVDTTLADVLVDNARAILEAERPWMVLRKTNTSLSASSADTWQTAKATSGITGWSGRFFGELPIRLFDGVNRIEKYRQVPWESRLEYKDVGNTFVYDANSGNIYLNGLVPFSGTLYINYLHDTGALDLAADAAVWSPFPARFLPILGYYAIGIHKGAVDYDSINRQMLPSNQAALDGLKNAMEKWDNELQLASIEGNDPTEIGSWRSGAVHRE